MNDQTKKLVTNGGIVLAVLIVGVLIGTTVSRGTGGENTFQAGWDAAKKRLSETGYAFPVMAEINSVSGEVTEVMSNGLTVKIRPLEPLADPALDMRTISFDANTKVYRTEQKDPVVYQKEVEEYTRKMQQFVGKPGAAPADMGTPPQPSMQKETKVSDIQKGDMVIVTAGKNIKEVKEFIAVTIVVQTPIATGAAVPASVR